MSMVRTVRPRPLGVDERIPLFWAGEDAPPEIRAVDGGSLYRYLVAGTPKTGQKRARGDAYHAPREGMTTPRPRKKGAQQQQEPAASGPRIHVPKVRPVRDYAANVAALQPRPTFAAEPGGALAAPYVRWHPPLPGAYDEGRPAAYDADEADEAWLERAANGGPLAGGDAAGRGGLMAAARGLAAAVANRFRSSTGGSELPTPRVSEAGNGGEPTGPGPLTLDAFERAIERLEMLHFAAVSRWWSDVNDGPSTSAPAQAPKIPATKTLLPRARAVEELGEIVPDARAAAALYDHWHKRRQQQGGPLLEHLWFEVPWKFVAFAHLLGDEEGDDEALPFMANESRSAKRARGARRRVTEEDAHDAMLALRSELEVVRTLADQVRRREKTKRLLLQLWRREVQLRLATGRGPPATPRPHFDSREVPHWGHGIGHPLGRGATSSRAPSRLATPAPDSDADEEDEPYRAAARQHQALVAAALEKQQQEMGGLNRRGRPARAAAAMANAGILTSVLADTAEDFWPTPGAADRAAAAAQRAARQAAEPAPKPEPASPPPADSSEAAEEEEEEEEEEEDAQPTWGHRRPRDSPYSTPRSRRPLVGRKGRQAVKFARLWEGSDEEAAADDPLTRRAAPPGGGGRGRGRGRGGGAAGRGRAAPSSSEEEEDEEDEPAPQQKKQQQKQQQQRGRPAAEPSEEEEEEEPPAKRPRGRPPLAAARGRGRGRPPSARPQLPRADSGDGADDEGAGDRKQRAGAPAPRGRGRGRGGRAAARGGGGRGRGRQQAEQEASSSSEEEEEEEEEQQQRPQHTGGRGASGATRDRGRGRGRGRGAAGHDTRHVRIDVPPSSSSDGGVRRIGRPPKAGKRPVPIIKRAALPKTPGSAARDEHSWSSGRGGGSDAAQAAAARPPATRGGRGAAAGPRAAAGRGPVRSARPVAPPQPPPVRGGRGGGGGRGRGRGRGRAAAPPAGGEDHHAPRAVGRRELRDLGINDDALEVAATWKTLFKPHRR